MPINTRKEYTGPAILSFGFRPFFMIASAYAALAILLWVPMISGALSLPTAFPLIDWHIHEIIFGFVSAVICGFLFTAVPNWTGRMPVQGTPLFFMLLLWLAGRFAVAFSEQFLWIITLIVDSFFLMSLWVVIAVEIYKGKNWRNLKMLLPLSLLCAANIGFHLEIHISGSADYSKRLAIAAVIAFVLLIGGRIIPSFTRNWLARDNPGRLPASFGAFEKGNLATAIVTLISWILFPDTRFVGFAFFISSALLLIQLSRWAGYRTFREPLVLILHISYLFIPIGFFLIGLAILSEELIPAAAGIHALGTGGISCMIISVMIRATKGHTGRALSMNRMDHIIFWAIFLSAITRIIAASAPGELQFLMHCSALFWITAFTGFFFSYGVAMFSPRN